MITPIWEPRDPLPHEVRTRFRLRYSTSHDYSLEDLCAHLEAQHASIIFALRQLKEISIDFRSVEGRSYKNCFRESASTTAGLMSIISVVSNTTTQHTYRTFTRTIQNMPKQPERSKPVTKIKIGFPVTSSDDGIAKTATDGQFVFAFLPVVQMPQLQFLIHADFVLPASRQAVTDNPWNRRLRDEVALLFAFAVRDIALKNNQLSYRWLAYIPTYPITGFWQPLQRLITQNLSEERVLYSRAGVLFEPSTLRILSNFFTHKEQPLLPEVARPWHFLSPKYLDSHSSALKSLGVKVFSYDDAFDLIDDDLRTESSSIQTTPLQDTWHNSFITFIKEALSRNSSSYRDRIYEKCIVPVRVQSQLEWRRPAQDIYFPTVVDEGTGSERITIGMPVGVDLVVLHPDAATESSRLEVYQLLGVCHCPNDVVCTAIKRWYMKPGTKGRDDLRSSLEILFWSSYKISPGTSQKLLAVTAKPMFLDTRKLYMRSDQPYHAERLLRLAENPCHAGHFLSDIYQKSSVSTRSRGGLMWEQWLCQVAGVRWYPPLESPDLRDSLYWMIETIRIENPAIFVPFIQNYWSQGYGDKCRSNLKIKQALQECKILCQHGGFEELRSTWFPSRYLVQAAKKYGVESRLAILTLPESTEDHLISQWPCLTELGVRSSLDLSFYRQTLGLLSAAGAPPAIGTRKMGFLYNNMGDRVTLGDRNALKVSEVTGPCPC